jgi:AcrR family transcriptional regulator
MEGKLKTKDKVLDAALALFNGQGTAAVSTNHIAEAAGISPGNLYYHYKNKEEIIRALFERLFAAWDVAFDLPQDALPTLADVQRLVGENFRIVHAYAFAHRELIALLRNDDALRARFIAVRARGLTGFQEIVGALVLGGVLKPLSEAEIEHLADLCWLISEFWVSSLEVGGQAVDDGGMQRGIHLMLHAVKPYMNG